MTAANDHKRALYAFCTYSTEQMEINTKLQDNQTDIAKFNKNKTKDLFNRFRNSIYRLTATITWR